MKEMPSYYSILTADIRYDTKLSWFEKVLFSEISALTNKTGECWASNKYFAEVFDQSERTITRSISTLKELGYVELKLEFDGKAITKRTIVIAKPLDNNVSTPIDKNVYPPIDKNGEYNTTSKTNNTSININRDLEDFAIFWKSLLGRKKNKNDAFKAYQKINCDLTADKLAEKFNKLLQVREEKYVPYPQKWLKNEGWNEEETIGERRGDFHYDAPPLQVGEQEASISIDENKISDVPDTNASQEDLCKHYIQEYEKTGDTKMANYYRDHLVHLQEQQK
tara:strand:- start:7447 stop:8286 length:840 start_codon:yes stop_codon:yes gene_type:complete